MHACAIDVPEIVRAIFPERGTHANAYTISRHSQSIEDECSILFPMTQELSGIKAEFNTIKTKIDLLHNDTNMPYLIFKDVRFMC